MRTSAVIWTILIVIVIAGIIWWIVGSGPSTTALPPSAAGEATTTSAPSSTATTTAGVPGENLTLGQDSTAAAGTFLIGYNGMTLYTYAKDTAGRSACTGSCVGTWPPYTVTSAANLVAESPLDSTKIGTITRADGSIQVTYGGKPLYFYSGDSASGETMGEGVGGVWHVAKP